MKISTDTVFQDGLEQLPTRTLQTSDKYSTGVYTVYWLFKVEKQFINKAKM